MDNCLQYIILFFAIKIFITALMNYWKNHMKIKMSMNIYQICYRKLKKLATRTDVSRFKVACHQFVGMYKICNRNKSQNFFISNNDFKTVLKYDFIILSKYLPLLVLLCIHILKYLELDLDIHHWTIVELFDLGETLVYL